MDERIKGFTLQFVDRSGVVAARFRDSSRGACALASLKYAGGGDTTGQGNGDDGRNEGGAEQHCKECMNAVAMGIRKGLMLFYKVSFSPGVKSEMGPGPRTEDRIAAQHVVNLL